MGEYAGQSSVETQAICAALAGNMDELERIVDGMSRPEIANLRSAAEMVAGECDAKLRGSNRR